MNNILSVVLLTAILALLLVFRTTAEKFLRAFRDSDSATDQNEWHGNRVRATGKR